MLSCWQQFDWGPKKRVHIALTINCHTMPYMAGYMCVYIEDIYISSNQRLLR